MTQGRGPTIEDIKRVANQRPSDILRLCGIAESFGTRDYISMCNPVKKDRHPSFTIWYKNGTLSFREENGPAKGDVIDFVAYMNGWYDGPKKGVAEACNFLKDKLGLARVDPHQLARDRRGARRQQQETNKKAAEKLADEQAEAFKLFTEAQGIRDTLAWRYLKETVGIDLDELPRGERGGDRTPSALRFLPAHYHTDARRDLPCMIACCTDTQGAIKAVHRTWLAPDGGKLKHQSWWRPAWPARKVWPSFTGLVIPLWRGSSNLSIKATAECGLQETLQMGEGVEKSLAMALAQPDLRTWAFISLGNLRHVKLPPCIDSVIVQRDNEWHNRQAAQAFESGMRALEAQGRPARAVASFIGKDFDDALRGEEP